ncbi:MAG: hypothetical protein SWZ49_23035, partial [Cyanobacteriota bacterium]|nr:hypothetical protein [Cyanobacteriota bacterium]
MNFNLDEAIKTANQLIFNKFRKHLTDLQIIVFRGSWDKEVYDAIAARHDYSFCYIRSDVAPNLWNMLSESLGERVTKSNFKEALKRYWLQQPVFEETNEYWQNNVNNQNNTALFI